MIRPSGQLFWFALPILFSTISTARGDNPPTTPALTLSSDSVRTLNARPAVHRPVDGRKGLPVPFAARYSSIWFIW